MKRVSTLILIFAISASLFSQQRTRSLFGWHLEKDAPIQRNEVKLNLATSIFSLYPEVSYEHIFTEDFSVGTSAGIGLGAGSDLLDFALTPFARWYLGGNTVNLQRYGAGFFLELNSSMHSNDGYFGAGLGLALGWKYVTKNNWVVDLYSGIGRDFVLDDAYPRMGITLGRRF